MKKIIIALILSLSFLSTYADVIMPWQPRPCYNDYCIEKCFQVTWDFAPLCKYRCVCWHEEFKSGIIGFWTAFDILFLVSIILFSFLLLKKIRRKE